MSTEFAYLAGYIDGDGCFYLGTTIQKPKNIIVFEYSVQILSAEKENLDSFLPYGGYIMEKPQRKGHKIPYCWTLKSCEDFCTNIVDFLIDKKFQCIDTLLLIQTIRQSNFQKYEEQTYRHRVQIINNNRRNKMSDLVTKENIEKIKDVKPSITPSDVDFAYLAGLIEAEGTFRIKSWKPKNRPNKVYNTSLEIGNTRYPIFPWLMDRFGGNISLSEKKTRKRAVAIWSLQSASLLNIVEKIYPFLRTRKKKVCELLMEFNKTLLSNGGDRHSLVFKERMKAVLVKRETIIEEVHKLNKKGV